MIVGNSTVFSSRFATWSAGSMLPCGSNPMHCRKRAGPQVCRIPDVDRVQVDVRPADSCNSGRPDTGMDVPVPARRSHLDDSAPEHLDGPPRDLASQLREAEARCAREDQRGPVTSLRLFLKKLDGIREADSTLLDRSLILFGSNLSVPASTAQARSTRFVAGGAAGRIAGGRYLRVCWRYNPTDELISDNVG